MTENKPEERDEPTKLEKELASEEIKKAVAEGFVDEDAVAEHTAEIERLKGEIRKETIDNILSDLSEGNTTK